MKKTLLILAACLALAGCADAIPVVAAAPSGFWVGLWHGLILPIAFIISLFNHNVGIYEAVNTGWPYNLGFVLGAGGIASGIGGWVFD